MRRKERWKEILFSKKERESVCVCERECVIESERESEK